MENLPKDIEELKELPVSQKMRAADQIGYEAAKFINDAIVKSNEFLKPYGYKVSVDLKFHLLDEKEESEQSFGMES